MTHALTQQQLAQVLDWAQVECREEGQFDIDMVFEDSGINIWIAGNTHITAQSSDAYDWYNDGYNDDEYELERTATITDAKVFYGGEEYELDAKDYDVINNYINDTTNFN